MQPDDDARFNPQSSSETLYRLQLCIDGLFGALLGESQPCRDFIKRPSDPDAIRIQSGRILPFKNGSGMAEIDLFKRADLNAASCAL